MLSTCQEKALAKFDSSHNIFLTGVAGSGKSYLINEFLRDKDPKEYPILASTGAAAILLGGRTFHSFFGLGIMEKGVEDTVQFALKNANVKRRLKKAILVVIDEVSMLPGEALDAAEKIARGARRNDSPWGGLRVVVVGDFAQLPPVSQNNREKPWAFRHPVWSFSEFVPAILHSIQRTQEEYFLKILNAVRIGEISSDVEDFLQERADGFNPDFSGTRLFARKDATDRYNLQRLAEISAPEEKFATDYWGIDRFVEALKRQAPIGDVITLKEGAFVMLRQNDMMGRWVNGSLGTYRGRDREEKLVIELLSGVKVRVEKTTFALSDGEGDITATARNYPVNLAWGSTIHKAQGATFDRLSVDLRNLWEPGHAYVALSRVRSSEGLFVEGWTRNSFRVSPEVVGFHKEIGLQ
jgi:ATP-dependent exoDNAse (exonuclease V) alpha subunit